MGKFQENFSKPPHRNNVNCPLSKNYHYDKASSNRQPGQGLCHQYGEWKERHQLQRGAIPRNSAMHRATRRIRRFGWNVHTGPIATGVAPYLKKGTPRYTQKAPPGGKDLPQRTTGLRAYSLTLRVQSSIPAPRQQRQRKRRRLFRQPFPGLRPTGEVPRPFRR